MSFPINWITYLSNAGEKPEPCEVDIVGNDANPALFFQIDADSIYFRMRLSGDPNANNPNKPLKNAVWGVQIFDETNTLLFTIRLNSQGNNNLLQVINETSQTIILNETITLGSNVEVNATGSKLFNCGNNATDWFLAFKAPLSLFNNINFNSTIVNFCYFTSEETNNINKEYLCGPFLNTKLIVKKEILSGETTIFLNDIETWVLRITVENPSSAAVTNVLVVDTIQNSDTSIVGPLNPTLGTAIISGAENNIIIWTIETLSGNSSATLDITLTGSFSTPGCRILNSGVVTADGIAEIPFNDTGICVVQQPVSRGIDLFACY